MWCGRPPPGPAGAWAKGTEASWSCGRSRASSQPPTSEPRPGTHVSIPCTTVRADDAGDEDVEQDSDQVFRAVAVVHRPPACGGKELPASSPATHS